MQDKRVDARLYVAFTFNIFFSTMSLKLYALLQQSPDSNKKFPTKNSACINETDVNSTTGKNILGGSMSLKFDEVIYDLPDSLPMQNVVTEISNSIQSERNASFVYYGTNCDTFKKLVLTSFSGLDDMSSFDKITVSMAFTYTHLDEETATKLIECCDVSLEDKLCQGWYECLTELSPHLSLFRGSQINDSEEYKGSSFIISLIIGSSNFTIIAPQRLPVFNDVDQTTISRQTISNLLTVPENVATLACNSEMQLIIDCNTADTDLSEGGLIFGQKVKITFEDMLH